MIIAAITAITAIIVVLLVVLALYTYTGWTKFEYVETSWNERNSGEIPSACTNCTFGKCPDQTACCPPGTTYRFGKCLQACTTNYDCVGDDVCDAGTGVCKPAATPTWVAAGGRSVSALRFKNCKFMLTDPAGNTHTQDVTANLNGMAVAYAGAAKAPNALFLDQPLNPFSFPVAGVNDVVAGMNLGAWSHSKVSLTGEYRTLPA